MSDKEITVIGGIITAFIGLLGTAISGYIAYKMAQLTAGQKETAKLLHETEITTYKKLDDTVDLLKASDRKTDGRLEEIRKIEANTTNKLDKIARVSDAVHGLVNSAMTEQKRLLAVSTRSKAEITKDPADVQEAEAAEQSYKDHVSQQLVLDTHARKTLEEEIKNHG